MPRVKIKFPDGKPVFETKIPVRITDMNYGNHLGNDHLLSIIHEARVQWLNSLGCTELDVGGCGLIMADVMIAYKNEGFYGDELLCAVFVDEIQTSSFDVLYRISTERKENRLLLAEAKTGMVCFDYQVRKIVQVPEKLLNKLCKTGPVSN
jgi:acyl-CoA thioesterase FadM